MATVSLQASYDHARRLLESGDAERAVAVAQHILNHFPKNLEAQRLLGEAYLAGRQLDEAQAAFQTALASDPENIPAYVGLGITHERQGELDQAIQAFEHALEIKPDMPELRSQLLRLYTETWGSEGAQLRLSRAGLARLYAKGHMLSQAVQEFRSVIADLPERLDARVALAEVLWRDGQEDAAITTSEEILEDFPYALKPNLLLGYLKLAAGDPAGEGYWNRALELDPYQTVARTMFEQLPYPTPSQPTLPEWDEQGWQQERESQARTREEAEQRSRIAPVAAATGAAAGAAATTDFFGDSWMDSIEPLPQAQPAADSGDDDFLARLLAFDGLQDEPEVAGASADDSALAPFSIDDVAPMTEPFSFEEPSPTQEQPAAQQPASADDQQLAPFSLADLGLSEEEIAKINQDEIAAEVTAPQLLDDDQQLAPFSLADLGLSEEEIARLQAADEQEQTQPAGQIGPVASSATASPTTPPAEEEVDLAPFSLADLGLSEEEIAQFGQGEAQPTASPTTPPAEEEVDLAPFSLADLGLSEEEIAQLGQGEAQPAAPASANDDFEGVKPFSLDDWGIGDTSPRSQVDGDDDNFELPDELRPFSLDDLDINASGAQAGMDIGALPPSLQPFSLDDVADTPPPASGITSLPLELPNDDEGQVESGGYSFRQAPSKANTDFVRDQQEPQTSSGPSIFAKLRQRHSELPVEEPPPLPPVADDEMDMTLFGGDDISLRDEEPFEPTAAASSTPATMPQQPASDEPDMTPFSFADLGLSEDEVAALDLGEADTTQQTAAPEPVAAPEPAASDEPDMTPFSFADLGLSEDEIAALDLGEADTTKQTAAPESVAAPQPAASDEPDMTPFSLADLGLSEEEIAALGLGEADAAKQTAAPEPVAAPQPAASDEPDMTPFSLSDLGLSEEEIAALGLGETAGQPVETAQPQQPESLETFDFDLADEQPAASSDSGEDLVFDFDMLGEQPTALTQRGQEEGFDEDIRPFSLDDLGINEDGVNPFGDLGSELGLTEEELAGMDLGALEQAGPAGPQQNADEEQYQVDTGDPVLDRLITIGRRQGFVDLDDIIQAVENPEEESERIEEIGLVLHRAGIQIRDGDEIIDMDEDAEEEYVTYAEDETEEVFTSPVVSSEEPDMTPFSLSDLGLSEEEIAALGLEETTPNVPSAAASAAAPSAPPAPTSPAPSADEPDLTPFSLADLGLSEEEIAALGLEEAAPAAAPSPPPAAAPVEAPTAPPNSDEPDMTPFSLADLGLSDGEIAELGLEEATPAAATPPPAAPAAPAEEPAAAASDEPDMTPFSLADLGLSEEEIAALGLEEASPPQASAQMGISGDDLDTFDFSVAESARQEVAPPPSTPRVREEEPPPPQSPEDLAFVPKPLEELDSIWEPVVPPAVSAVVAPTPEPPKPAEPTRTLPPVSERILRFEKPPQREQSRSEPAPPPRREPPQREQSRSEPAQAQPPAREPQPARASTPARQARPGTWQARQSPTAFIPTGDPALDGYLLQLEAEPHNTGLRVAVARIGGQTGRFDLAVQQYKTLIKGGDALDQVADDLQELIEDTEDHSALQKLYRLLGDTYTKQNRFRDAVEAYSWTFTQ